MVEVLNIKSYKRGPLSLEFMDSKDELIFNVTSGSTMLTLRQFNPDRRYQNNQFILTTPR